MQHRIRKNKSPSSCHPFPLLYGKSYKVDQFTNVTKLINSQMSPHVLQGPPGRAGLPGADGLAGPPGTMLMLPVSTHQPPLYV